jgi:hypothetical protein
MASVAKLFEGENERARERELGAKAYLGELLSVHASRIMSPPRAGGLISASSLAYTTADPGTVHCLYMAMRLQVPRLSCPLHHVLDTSVEMATVQYYLQLRSCLVQRRAMTN